MNLLVLLPFYAIYVPASVYFKSFHTYPTWIFGILISIAHYILLRKRTSIQFYFAFSVIITLLTLSLFLPNYYSYIDAQKNPEYYSLDKVDIKDSAGKVIPISEFKGKVVLLDIWNTACIPCIENFPKLERLYHQVGIDSNVVIGTLNIPIERENDMALANNYTHKYTFRKFYLKDMEAANSFGIKTVPLVLIFDKGLRCRFAGSLNYGTEVFIGNSEKIINNLKSELE